MKNIIGHKVILKPLSSKNRIQIDQWNQDPLVSQFREIGTKPKSKNINLAIFDLSSNKLIGDVGINSIDLVNHHAEIGLAIGDKNYWGKGYGTDVIKTALDYCFDQLKLNKVYLDVWQENQKAINCYLKCGFKQDGILRQHVKNKDGYHDKLVMSILKSEHINIEKK
ncbi:MAG: GNAT family protein [Candidatus Shapirobacteria bacterium]